MERPQVKTEIVVKTCPNPAALAIEVATPRALEWAIKEGSKYTADRLYALLAKDAVAPYKTVLVVSQSYDVHEVKKHLENPSYGNKAPLRIV